jgi:N-hydroxyarylamine O-acetyltransferase
MSLLPAYLARIGIDSASATLAGVTAMHRAHVAAIPFENLDVVLGATPSLALDDVAAKLLGRRRGGYCFEQNTLFRAVLEELGLPVTLLLARVRLGTESIRPRTHALLWVEVEGRPYLMDVGFGGWGLAVPLRLDAGVQRHDGLMTHRLMKTGDLWVLQAGQAEGWTDLYAFTLERHHRVDLEMANHYTATYVDSPFRHHLLAHRVCSDRRVILQDRRMTTLTAAGWQSRELADDPAVMAALADELALAPPPGLAEHLACRPV